MMRMPSRRKRRSAQRRRSWKTFGAGGLTLAASLSLVAVPPVDAGEAAEPAAPYVPLLGNDQAWEHLPECEAAGAALPNWARALAAALPYTTGAALELDGVYRSSEEFDPQLRAKMRWVAARANGCAYGEAYALADLRRAGADKAEIAAFQASRANLPAAERAALAFALKMTTAAYTVTDEEVATLRREYGERPLVAMVLQLAYANFLDRLVLSLGVPIEEDGPLPPRVFGFPAFASLDEIPAAPRPDKPATSAKPVPAAELPRMKELFGREWSALPFAQLQQMMEQQQAREGRVSVPDWETVRDRLPPGMHSANRPMKIRWSLVVLGHQPHLGVTWLRCLRVFGREAHFDRVLAESMFWVVTRSLQCFY